MSSRLRVSPPGGGAPALLVGLVVLLTLAALGGCAAGESAPAEPGTTQAHVRAGAGRGEVVAAARVLRSWDGRRAAAYAEGSVARLRHLYVAGAGRADVRLLSSYLRRGLRVEEMTVQVLALDVLGHRTGSWTLRVTDRLSRAVAVGRGTRVVLPRDAASTRLVRLVRLGERWRVAGVRADPVS